MTTATTTLSSKSQIVIPQTILDQLHWESGGELIIETTDAGVLLKSKPSGNTLRLEELRGFLQSDGPALSIEGMRLAPPSEHPFRNSAC